MSSAFIPGQPPYRMQLLGGGSQIHPVPNQQAEVLRPLPRVDPNSMEELLNNQINTIMQMLHKEVEAHNNTRTQLHTYVQSKLHWERWFKKNDIENQYLHGVIQDLRTKNQEEKIKQFIGQEEGLNALQESCHNGLPVHNLSQNRTSILIYILGTVREVHVRQRIRYLQSPSTKAEETRGISKSAPKTLTSVTRPCNPFGGER